MLRLYLSLLIAFAFLVAPVYAGAAILTVGRGGNYASIGEAIRAAAAGDTIVVRAGEYRENVVIDKPLTIRGEGDPSIIGGYTGDVVRIEADDVTLDGFRLSQSGGDMMRSNAGIRIMGDRARVLNCKLTDNLFGVYLGGSDYSLVEGNTIVGRKDKGIGERGPGVQLFDSNHNTIRGNEIYYVRDGVYFDHADFNAVEDNDLHDLRYGVHYMSCDDNSFHRNTFRDSMAGAAIMYTRRVVFSDNLIMNIREGYSAYGLLLKDAEDCTAERNVIINCATGIFIEGSNRNRISNNLVAYNDLGAMIFASSMDTQFSANDFVGNIADLHTVGRAQADWAPGGKGNHYSSYDGYDIDGDGIGDVEYKLQDVFELLEGSYPILRLYLSSGAADAMLLAERTFPIIEGSDLKDPAPRMRPVSGMKLSDFPVAVRKPNAPLAASLVTLAFTAAMIIAGWRLAK